MPDVNILVKAKDETSKVLGGIGGSLKKMGKIAAGVGLVGVAALAGIALGATKLAMDAAKLEPTRVTFDNLTNSIGSTADAMLKKLRPATMGIVSDADLMQAANKLIAMGLAESEEEAAKLAEMAVTLGMAMGEDATNSMENFALMMANQSIPRLDSFGISSSKVRERILELMEANKDMSRETAFNTAVLEQGGAAMDKVGDISETGAVKMAQFQTTITNVKDTVGKALLPVLHAFMDKVMTPLAKKLEEVVPKVEMLIGVFSDLITEVFGGDMERAIGFLQNEVWEVLDHVFGAEMADKIVGLGTKVLEWVETFRTDVIPVIQDLASQALPLLQKGLAFVTEHWQTFAKIGAVVGAVLIAVSSPITVVIAAIAALAIAWSTNWGGIQDKLKAVWAFLQPVLNAIKGALGWVARVVTESLIPAIGRLLGWMGDKLAPLFRTFIDEMAPRISSAFGTFKEIISAIATFIGDTVVPAIVDFWQGTEDIRQSIVDFAGNAAVVGLKAFLEGTVRLWDLLKGAIEGVRDAIGWVIDKIREVIDWFNTLGDRIPDWLKPGSPSSLETSVRGIADAFRDLNVAMGTQPYAVPVPVPVGGAGGGDTIINVGGVQGAWGPEETIEDAFRDVARYTL